jgi:hypothetical protein
LGAAYPTVISIPTEPERLSPAMRKKLIGTRVKCIASLTGLAIIGIGPVPFTEILGFYIITKRPRWFKNAVRGHFAEARRPKAWVAGHPHLHVSRPRWTVIKTKAQCYAALTGLATLGIALIPATDILSFYVFLTNAPWFARLVDRLYLGVDDIPIKPGQVDDREADWDEAIGGGWGGSANPND